MAERRMFALKIVDSDAFLDLPLSAQALYFHLGMHADDDGFLNNANRITRTIGASANDLEILLEKRFLLSFPSGVIVVKHWKMHNQIKGDRYKRTQYQEEFQKLRIKSNKSYTDRPEVTEVAPPATLNEGKKSENLSGSSLDPEGSIDQFSLNQCSKDEDKEESLGDAPKDQCAEVIELYHEECISYPQIKKITPSRRKAIIECLKLFPLEKIGRAFEMAEASRFLKGDHDGKWVTDFDWIIKSDNMVKILEGKYMEREKDNGEQCGERKLDVEEKKAIWNMMKS